MTFTGGAFNDSEGVIAELTANTSSDCYRSLNLSHKGTTAPQPGADWKRGVAQSVMPNIAAVLKAEIARVARKEARREVEALKKAAAGHRSQITELKRQLQELERALRALRKAAPNASLAPASETPGKPLRFSAARLAAQRRRLGLSAELFGKLVGTSGQTIYLWERGKTRPSAENLASIAALRRIGKRALATRLASLR